jgi:hypothetical protein
MGEYSEYARLLATVALSVVLLTLAIGAMVGIMVLVMR